DRTNPAAPERAAAATVQCGVGEFDGASAGVIGLCRALAAGAAVFAAVPPSAGPAAAGGGGGGGPAAAPSAPVDRGWPRQASPDRRVRARFRLPRSCGWP